MKNAYAENGIAATYSSSDTSSDNNSQSQSIIDSIKESASNAAESITKAVEDANIGEKAKNLWDSVVDFFR